MSLLLTWSDDKWRSCLSLSEGARFPRGLAPLTPHSGAPLKWFFSRNIWECVSLLPSVLKQSSGIEVYFIPGTAIQYDVMFYMTIEKRLSFHIVLNSVFRLFANNTLQAICFCLLDDALHSCSWHRDRKWAWRQHKQTLRRLRWNRSG